MITEDWLWRQVESLNLMVTRLLLHKDEAAYELPVNPGDYSENDRLCALVRGCIRDADAVTALELLDTADEREGDDFAEIALEAYRAMNNLEEETLEENDISRHEFLRGIKDLASERGFNLWKEED